MPTRIRHRAKRGNVLLGPFPGSYDAYDWNKNRTVQVKGLTVIEADGKTGAIRRLLINGHSRGMVRMTLPNDYGRVDRPYSPGGSVPKNLLATAR